MAVISPFKITDETVGEGVGSKKWVLVDDKLETVVSDIVFQSATAFNSLYAVSLIKLQHPDGKVWESMFVPFNKTSSKGFCITRWGKNNKVKGQMQVKSLSEPDWYKMVNTKYKSGGYEVKGYMGIETPHSSRHVIVTDVMGDYSIPNLPQLAWDSRQHDPIVTTVSVVGLGREMAAGLINHRATHNFLAHLNTLGHDYGLELQVLFNATSGGNAVNNMDKSRLEGIVSGLIGFPCTNGGVVYGESSKVQAIAREETYSGWGAFG